MGGSDSHLTSWIKSINIKRKIDRLGSTNAVFNLLDDAVHSNCVNLSGFHDFETTIPIIFIVARAAQSCSDTRMDVGIIGK